MLVKFTASSWFWVPILLAGSCLITSTLFDRIGAWNFLLQLLWGCFCGRMQFEARRAIERCRQQCNCSDVPLSATCTITPAGSCTDLAFAGNFKCPTCGEPAADYDREVELVARNVRSNGDLFEMERIYCDRCNCAYEHMRRIRGSRIDKVSQTTALKSGHTYQRMRARHAQFVFPDELMIEEASAKSLNRRQGGLS
jgi:hypothetical protein